MASGNLVRGVGAGLKEHGALVRVYPGHAVGVAVGSQDGAVRCEVFKADGVVVVHGLSIHTL